MGNILLIAENTLKILQGLSGFLVVAIILLSIYIAKKRKKKPAEWRTKTDPKQKAPKKEKKSKKEKSQETESTEESIDSQDEEKTD